LAKLVLLVAALLPVAGVAIRMIAFLCDPYLRNVSQLAVALPIVNLTALAAWLLLGPVASLMFVVANIRWTSRSIAESERRSSQRSAIVAELEELTTKHGSLRAQLDDLQARMGPPDSPAPTLNLSDVADEVDAISKARVDLDADTEAALSRYHSWRDAARPLPTWIRVLEPVLNPVARFIVWVPRGIRIAASIGVLVVASVVLPIFPLIPIILLTSFASQVLLTRSIKAAGDFRLRHAWPGVAVFMAGYVLASGLTYQGPYPATFHFATTAGVPDGSYAELGRSDDLLYIRPCPDIAKGSLAVPLSAITLIEFPPPVGRPIGPSLLDVLRGKATLRLGTVTQCDVP
jgi:hypothetical protein